MLYHRHGDACLLGRAWAGGNANAGRCLGFDLTHGDGIVAMHLHLGTEFPEILDDIPGEGVIVVDHQYHIGLATLTGIFRV